MGVDGSGDVIRASTEYNGINVDLCTIRYAAADGAVVWETRYNSGLANAYTYARAVAFDETGNVFVTGIDNGVTNGTCYTAKYAAADGAVLWEKHLPCLGYALDVDSNGNVFVAGGFSSGTTNDFYTAKLAALNGALLWDRLYNGPSNQFDIVRSMAVDTEGNAIVTGASSRGSNSIDHGKYEYYTAKYRATDGGLLWERRFSGVVNGANEVKAIAIDSGGDVFVTGYSGTPSATPDWNTAHNDWYTAKYAAVDGALLWEKRHNGPKNSPDRATAVVIDNGGNVNVTGYSLSFATSYDYYTAKYAGTNGALLWETRYDGPAHRHDKPTALAVDSNGNVIVTGQSHNGTNYDYCTAKYAAANGALIWEKRYNGSQYGDDLPVALAVDASGNVVVTGSSKNPTGSDTDYYTVKYAEADGSFLWEKRYANPSRNDSPSAVATDSTGNVFVTGSSENGSGSTYDYYTAKYAAANGALLWEKRYNSPSNGNDVATALVLDNNGNVVVTGSISAQHYMVVNMTNYVLVLDYYDYYTAKYGAANGSLLWEKRYNAPANDDDKATALAMDAVGNVFVTGQSRDPTNSHCYTAKYAATDGALLWEQRYRPIDDGTTPPRLALGTNGTVAHLPQY
jgi:uncharacterized delta-60 repeat protein